MIGTNESSLIRTLDTQIRELNSLLTNPLPEHTKKGLEYMIAFAEWFKASNDNSPLEEV